MDFTLLLVFGVVTTIIFVYQNQQISQLKQQITDHDDLIHSMQLQLNVVENISLKPAVVTNPVLSDEQVQAAMDKTQIFEDIREIYRRIDGAIATSQQLTADVQALFRRSLNVGEDSNVCVLSSFQGCPGNTHSWGGFSLEFDTTVGERTAPPGYVIGEPVKKTKGQWHLLYGEFCCSKQRH